MLDVIVTQNYFSDKLFLRRKEWIYPEKNQASQRYAITRRLNFSPKEKSYTKAFLEKKQFGKLAK